MIKTHEDILEKRNKTLQESRERTQRIFEKTENLGLIKIHKDFWGNIRVKKY